MIPKTQGEHIKRAQSGKAKPKQEKTRVFVENKTYFLKTTHISYKQIVPFENKSCF
jgi:hypothetical protein